MADPRPRLERVVRQVLDDRFANHHDEAQAIVAAVLDELGQAEQEPKCWCRDCNPDANGMIVCRDCGNKRCPHAHNHVLDCTRSNEPDQPGTRVFGPMTREDHEFWDRTRADLAEIRATRVSGRDANSGACSECGSPPEAYHARTCQHFNGYYCHRCEGIYYGDYCQTCPAPWWATELEQP